LPLRDASILVKGSGNVCTTCESSSRLAVTAVALVYQCAEITRIAGGRGTDSPKIRQASV